MQIAIIGAGNVGGAAASSTDPRRARRHDHRRPSEEARRRGRDPDRCHRGRLPGKPRRTRTVPRSSSWPSQGPVDRRHRRGCHGLDLDGKVVIDVSEPPDGRRRMGRRDLDRRGAPGHAAEAHVIKAFNTPVRHAPGQPPGRRHRRGTATWPATTPPPSRPSSTWSSRLGSGRWKRGLARERPDPGGHGLAEHPAQPGRGGTWQDAWVLVGPDTVPADPDSRN